MIVDAYVSGGADSILKPINPDVLRAKARVFLQLQDRTRSLVDYARQLHHAQQQAARSELAQAERVAIAATALRLTKLQQATAELARAKTPTEVAVVAVRHGAEAVGASGAALWNAEADGSLTLVGHHGYSDAYVAPSRSIPPGAAVPVMRVFESREAVWAENKSDHARLSPETYEHARAHGHAVAFAAIPLRTNGHALGVLRLTYPGDHAFPAEEKDFLIALARACEQALDRARLYVIEQEARRAAELAIRRKDDFLAILGHELRNPLSAMVTAFELVKSRGGPLPRELAVVDRQVGHLTRLVNDLVEVAQITHGAVELQREAVDASRAIADAISLARPVLDRHAHDVVVTAPSNLVLDADRTRVAQVLANLLTNSAKYTPGAGRIEVIAERADTYARIIVRDNGIGIPQPLLASLFDPFVQGERGLDRHPGGLGIGLTLVKTLVELHGGTVHAESDGLRKGATMTVRWPLSTKRTPTATMPISVPTPPSRVFKVLIVDDNVDAADMLASLLRSLGHEVDVAHDGVSAVDNAIAFQPHVAILDIGLPQRDGYALAEELRRTPASSSTILVALTGYGQPEDRERAFRAGFAHHYVKPLDVRAITALFATLATTADTSSDGSS